MSIRRFILTLPALVLVLILLAGVFPGGAAFAEEGGDPLALRFVCDETVASVTVYDPAGLPLPVGADGIHHLTPGTYFYSATAEGYENTGLQAFTIPADAAGDQELRISLTPVPGSIPPDAAPGQTAPDALVPGQLPVNVPDPNALKENPEDDGKLRIRPVNGSLTLTIERETRAESAVPPELQKLVEGKDKPLLTADGKPVEKKLWLKTPDAEELYLDRLAVEKEIGYYTTDWTVLNLTDEEGSRKNLVPASGWYDVTVSGPATEPYRAYEPVFALVTLHWDEEGDIVDRDVQILETTHTPTKSSWSFSTDTLSTLVIAVPTDRPVESEEAAAKKDRPAFAASSTVDGVTVTVSAPAGVFPADAALWVQRVPLTEEIDAAVEAERDEQKTVAVSYTFDIRVVNPETMEEYQPEEGQSVSVSFALAEVADENLETRVYHVTEEESTGALTAEALDVSESGLTATAETDGFSYYQVEFTYEKLEYVLPGDTSVPLAEILTELGLSGDVTEVSCSNANLFSCDWTENRWVVTAHRAFSSTEWMKVTLNNVVYEITVTDEGSEGFIFEDGGPLVGYTGNGGVVVIPDNYNGDPVTSIINAFEHNNNITNVVIPASVNYITSGSFSECENLLSVTFVGESALERIEDTTFSDCSKLNSINIPSGVTSIGGAAFYRCSSLTSINIPSGVTSIGPEAFGWTDLTGIEIPSGVTRIEGRTFEGCQNLTSINIPSGVTSIGEKAFDNCRKLNGVTFAAESELTSIGEAAFRSCGSLASIEIPSGVTSIGVDAFAGCVHLRDIWYHGTESQWNNVPKGTNWDGGYNNLTAHCELSITVEPSGSGTVSANFVADVPTPAAGKYWSNTDVTLTATPTPNSNYAFDEWTWTEGSETKRSKDNPYSFTATDDRDLTANFVLLATAPTITKQPQDLTLPYGYEADNKLSVTAIRATDGTYDLSYQWYKNGTNSSTGGTAIDSTSEPTAATEAYTIPTGKNAGTEYYYCVVTATRMDNGQTATASSAVATLTVRAADITITMADRTLPYDGQTQYGWSRTDTGKETVTGLVNNETVTITYTPASGLAVGPVTSGVYDSSTLEIKDGDKNVTGNYNLKSLIAGTLTISKKPVTVTAAGQSVELNGSITPFASDPAMATLSDAVTGHSLGGVTLTASGTANVTTSGTITPSDATIMNGSENVTANYEIGYGNGTLTVTRTQPLEKDPPTAAAVTYGDKLSTITGSMKDKYTDNEVPGSFAWQTSDAIPAVSDSNKTEYAWTFTPTDNVNYAPVTGVLTLTVSPRSVTVKADDKSSQYGADIRPLSFTVTGGSLVDGDTLESLGVTAATAATSSSNVGPYDIVLSGGTGNPNYSVTLENGTYTIEPAQTTLTDAQKPTPAAPTADGTPQALVNPPQELPSGYTGVQYSLDGGKTWTEPNAVPTAIVPDTYVVQVRYVPDENHTAFEGTPVTSVILPNYYVAEAESTSSWLKGSGEDAAIIVRLRGLSGQYDNSFPHFRNGGSVAIDGTVLSEDSSALIQKDYKAEAGSTVITLHKKMLNRLSAGEHTVRITFDNGEVEAPLTILVPPGGYSPGTGDSARVGFWAALMVLAGLGFAGADYARRRLRRPRYVGKHM